MGHTLGVGWDVGGWIGGKQGVAVARLGPSGAEWLGIANAFCLADLRFPDWTLLDLLRIAWRNAPEDTLTRFQVVLAIDAPLAFPIGFKQLIDTGVAPIFRPDGPEIQNPLAYRDCDRFIHSTLGKKPLSASFDKLGNNATVAMHHARRLARLHGATILPFDPTDDNLHALIEVYPALCKHRNAPCCHDGIQRLLPPGSVHNSDECDACICALMALAFGNTGRQSFLPPLVTPEAATIPTDTLRAEGWIYHVPRQWLASSG